tara:strand:+ start:10326 stop:11429 length:1104 start_codon:yes stop_codon:yes gene_type:complete
MENKKHLFICFSKYAILNSINLLINNNIYNNKNSDLVVFHRTLDMKQLSKNLRNENIFRNIFDFPFINKKGTFYLLKLFLFPRYFLSKISSNYFSKQITKQTYDVLISQNLLYASLFGRINSDAEIFLIEDGLSSYTSRTINPIKRSIYFQIANKFIFKNSILSSIKKQFLYKPKMFFGDGKNVLKIPKINSDSYHLYNKIFSYKKNVLYKSNKLVYLGVPFFGLKDLMLNPNEATKNFEVKCNYILNEITNISKKNKFIYRKHPIENIDQLTCKNNFIFDRIENTWEIECLNSISKQHIIVSFFSTASFTPKMLFDKEPYLIFLYKTLGIDFFNADKLVNDLKSLYKNPKKVILLEDINMIKDIIR